MYGIDSYSTQKDIDKIAPVGTLTNGGHGSGNFGHSGRLGLVGGAGKGESLASLPEMTSSERENAINAIKSNQYVYGKTEQARKSMDVEHMNDLELRVFERLATYKPVMKSDFMAMPRVREAEQYIKDNPKMKAEDYPELTAKVEQEFRDKIFSDAEKRGGAKKEHKYFAVYGLPGAGKSSTGLDEKLNNGYLELDNDIAKEVPSLKKYYAGGKGAATVQDIVSIAQRNLADKLMAEGYNIAYPAIGKRYDKISSELSKVAEHGYDTKNPDDVQTSFVNIKTATAMGRAVNRFYQTGRYVSPDYIATVGSNPKKAYDEIKKRGYRDIYTGEYVKVATKEKDNEK